MPTKSADPAPVSDAATLRGAFDQQGDPVSSSNGLTNILVGEVPGMVWLDMVKTFKETSRPFNPTKAAEVVRRHSGVQSGNEAVILNELQQKGLMQIDQRKFRIPLWMGLRVIARSSNGTRRQIWPEPSSDNGISPYTDPADTEPFVYTSPRQFQLYGWFLTHARETGFAEFTGAQIASIFDRLREPYSHIYTVIGAFVRREAFVVVGGTSKSQTDPLKYMLRFRPYRKGTGRLRIPPECKVVAAEPAQALPESVEPSEEASGASAEGQRPELSRNELQLELERVEAVIQDSVDAGERHASSRGPLEQQFKELGAEIEEIEARLATLRPQQAETLVALNELGEKPPEPSDDQTRHAARLARAIVLMAELEEFKDLITR